MGTVVNYPQRTRMARHEGSIADQPWSATVIILPAVQFETRHEMPSDRHSSETRLSRKPGQRTAPV
jgi:hypothetical protein